MLVGLKYNYSIMIFNNSRVEGIEEELQTARQEICTLQTQYVSQIYVVT